VVAQFLQMMQASSGEVGDLSAFRRPYRLDGFVDIDSVRVCGAPLGAATLEFGDNLSFDVDLTVKRPVEEGVVNIVILNEQLEPITTLASSDAAFFYALPLGRHTVHCNAGPLPLIPGDYRLTIGAGQKGGRLSWDVLETMPAFRVEGFRNAAWTNWPDRPGVVLFDHCKWRIANFEGCRGERRAISGGAGSG